MVSVSCRNGNAWTAASREGYEIVRDDARTGRNGLGTSSREPRGRRRGLSGHAPGADTEALLPLLLPEPPKRLPNIVVVWLPRFAMASARNG